MAKSASKLPVKKEMKPAVPPSALQPWRSFENLRQEADRLFGELGRDFWRPPFGRSMFDLEPFWRRELGRIAAPAVDIVEKDAAYEVTAELPGLDEKDIDVKIVNDYLTIKGEKREEKEEKKKGYYLQERHFGSFARSFRVPEGIDADKIQATFKKGVLKVTLPKRPEARKPGKKISVKGG
jgi:HSP20 family protein